MDPVEASTRLRAFPEATHAAMQMLARKLIDVEPLNNAQEAVTFLKEGWSPKLRRPFSREWLKEPPQKKKAPVYSPLTPVGDPSGIISSKKYGFNIPDPILNLLSNSRLKDDSIQLIAASLAKSTWKKYNSAFNSFKIFCSDSEISFDFPIDIVLIRDYVTWCFMTKNLKPATIKTYLSGLNFVNNLLCKTNSNFLEDKIVHLLILGAENTVIYKNVPEFKRRTFTIDSLLYLGHKIACSLLSVFQKQILWTAATLAFFTCARMGEILPSETNFDPETTLCWKNVKFLVNDEILIFLPFTKTKKTKGEFVDVFSFPVCCPVAALKKLYSLTIVTHPETNLANIPVFSFPDGKPLTTKLMNSYLKTFLSDLSGDEMVFSCHSFRSAIPSIVSNFPDQALVSDIKEWGNWKSDSYQLYMKLERDKRRKLFGKISVVLKSSSRSLA